MSERSSSAIHYLALVFMLSAIGLGLACIVLLAAGIAGS